MDGFTNSQASSLAHGQAGGGEIPLGDGRMTTVPVEKGLRLGVDAREYLRCLDKSDNTTKELPC